MTRSLAVPVLLLAFNTNIIVEHSRRAVGIDRDMQGLMYQKVVSRPLANDPEVVYVREIDLTILERASEALMRHTSRLVAGSRGFADTADSLWLEMEIAADFIGIDRERDQGVQGTAEVH